MLLVRVLGVTPSRDTNMPATTEVSAMGRKNFKPAPKVQKVTDGGGRLIQVEPAGSKLLRFAYRSGGKQKLISHGV